MLSIHPSGGSTIFTVKFKLLSPFSTVQTLIVDITPNCTAMSVTAAAFCHFHFHESFGIIREIRMFTHIIHEADFNSMLASN